jgi:Na+/H+ antiporter NhaC
MKNNWVFAVTYLIYIIFYEALVLGGCAYIVFGLGKSGWWFLLAVGLSNAAYSPKKWRELFKKIENIESKI